MDVSLNMNNLYNQDRTALNGMLESLRRDINRLRTAMNAENDNVELERNRRDLLEKRGEYANVMNRISQIRNSELREAKAELSRANLQKGEQRRNAMNNARENVVRYYENFVKSYKVDTSFTEQTTNFDFVVR